VTEACLGDRELDQDAVTGQDGFDIVGDRDIEARDAGDLARILPERRMTGSLERAYQAKICLFSEQSDETAAHPAGSAGDHDVGHGCARVSA